MKITQETLTDTEIIQSLAGAHDEDRVIRFLYREHYELLSVYVLNNSGNNDDAADIFQEVMIAFINLVKAGKFRGEASIKTFLFSLNKNIWLNELKKRGRSRSREMKYDQLNERDQKGIDMVIENRQGKDTLHRVMEELGETCRKILVLFYYESRSIKEILATLHYENEQVVRNKKSKCLKKLEEIITGNKVLFRQLKNFLNE